MSLQAFQILCLLFCNIVRYAWVLRDNVGITDYSLENLLELFRDEVSAFELEVTKTWILTIFLDFSLQIVTCFSFLFYQNITTLV